MPESSPSDRKADEIIELRPGEGLIGALLIYLVEGS